MWLLLVTTVACVVIANAGYLYNTPKVPFGLRRPAKIHHEHTQHQSYSKGTQSEDKTISYSVSYKDFVYLNRQDKAENSPQLNQNYKNLQLHKNIPHIKSTGEVLTTQNTQTHAGANLNKVYAGYAQSLPSATNYNNNYAQVYGLPAANVQNHEHHVVRPIINVGTNIGYSQASPASNLIAGYAQTNHLPVSASYSNNYVRTSPVVAQQNTEYAQTLIAPDNIIYNNDYPQKSAISTPAADENNVYTQSLISAAGNNWNGYNRYNAQVANDASNLNNRYIKAAHITTSLNNGYSENTQALVYLNRGYNKEAQAATSLNNGYDQVQATTALDNRYSHIHSLSNGGYSQSAHVTTSLDNGHSQASQVNDHWHSDSAYATSPLNNGYSHVTQVSAVLNSGHSQSAHPTSSLNDGYGQVSQVSAPINNKYRQSEQTSTTTNGGHDYPSPATNTFTNAYIQTATLNLNSGYDHSLTPSDNLVSNYGYGQSVSPTGSTDFNTGYTQSTAFGTNSIIGYPQTLTTSSDSFNRAYEQASITSDNIVNNDLASSIIPTTSDSSSTGFSQVSTGPTLIDLNSGVSQSLASSDTTVVSTFPQAASDNLNIGLTQTQANLNAAVSLNPVSVPSSPPVTPTIHKHIYFHVPPPEIEEEQRAPPPPPPPKKNYKILFIKVPSQESKPNVARLQQQIAQMQNAAVDHKTLIYVLVRNPEDPKPVVLPEHKPSEHQVFFVKYNGSPFDIASQVKDEFDKTGTVKSIVPLVPGLVDG